MQITHLGHAAVLVEMAGRRLLIDPGNFSTAWHGLTGLDAILVTHQHPDHVDPEHGPGLLQANPEALVAMEAEALAQFDLAAAGLPPDRISTLTVGDEVRLGAVTVTVVGGRHAVIHPDIPGIGNVGVVISAPDEPTFFHPGDELDATPAGIDVLAVPAFTPWAAMKEVVDFARAVGAPRGFPMHEGGFNDRGFALVLSRVSEMASMDLQDLRDGMPTTF
ncbi:MAG: MBL fold metallo-hydrolase [Propionibacteriales bacterium]|nr:MBL fold metallo-hydrolase [Propionibacteriales bacterium]